MLPYKCKLRSYGPSIAFLAFAMLKFLLKDFIPFSILWELCCTANVFIMCMYVTFDAILESAVEGLLLKPFLPWQCPLDNPTVNHNDLDVIFKPFTPLMIAMEWRVRREKVSKLDLQYLGSGTIWRSNDFRNDLWLIHAKDVL